MDAEERDSLEKQLRSLKRRLSIRREQKTKLGPIYDPLIDIDMEETEEKIARIERQLGGLPRKYADIAQTDSLQTQANPNTSRSTEQVLSINDRRIDNEHLTSRAEELQFGAYAYIDPCMLDEDGLRTLVKIIEEDKLPNRRTLIGIVVYIDDGGVIWCTIGEFLTKGLYGQVEKLCIRFFERKEDGELIRYISLDFTGTYIYLYIRGAEKTWVVWMRAEIIRYLNSNRVWYWFLRNRFIQTDRIGSTLRILNVALMLTVIGFTSVFDFLHLIIILVIILLISTLAACRREYVSRLHTHSIGI